MKCPNCQVEAAKDARFCGECGKPMPSPKAAAEPEIDFSALHTVDGGETRNPRDVSQKLMAPGEVFATRYEIVRLIGEGGMGVVYRARDKLTDKDVALKLIRADRLAGKDAVKRLINEGVTSRDIRHPNVVAVYDVGEANGQPYMSMEFLDGRSLRSWNRARMQANGDCSMKTAARVIGEILAGLEAAHKAGVVHRDLKPENVMLLSDPTDNSVRLKILDFGIARAGAGADTGATSLGTRGYMAPEQITAPDAAQPSADLYSLSVMFYEILVGVVPQGHWQPPSGGRSDVPPAIDDLVQKGLSNNPRSRPQNVAEYSAALSAAMLGGAKPVTVDKSLIEQFEKNPDVQRVIDAFKPKKPDQNVVGPTGKMSTWKWFIHGVTKRYADGKGRAAQGEYWGVILYAYSFLFLAVVLDVSMMADGSSDQPIVTFALAVTLVSPVIAATSRRLHDFGVTGWAAALCLVPALGLLPNIVIGVIPGKAGDNGYGPDPRAASGAAK